MLRTKTCEHHNNHSLFRARLKEWGLNYRRACEVGMGSASISSLEAKFPFARKVVGCDECGWRAGGVIIPYFHPLVRQGCRVFYPDRLRHAEPALLRARYFNPPIVSDKRTGRPKEIRYVQAKDSAVEAYFDPHINWMRVFADESIDIRIVEGEAKALFLNQHQRMLCTATVALGGVWNFREKGGKDLTPWLRMVRAASQRGRKVIVTFDSDIEDNTGIQMAEHELTELLAVRV